MKLSNGLSLSRLVFLGSHLYFSQFLSPFVNGILVILNYLLDSIDGPISRKFGGTSYGEFMDISVDRIITLGYYAFHVFNHRLNFFFFLAILFRNIFVDYISYFELIKKHKKERHKLNKGFAYWIYTSKISKIINGTLQMGISAWGFFGIVPWELQILFLITSYTRAMPSAKKLAKNI